MKLNTLQKNDILSQVTLRRDELTKRRSQIISFINSVPTGNLHIVNSNNRIQYHIRTENRQTYLSKKEKSKISKYLQKHYYKAVLKSIDKEIKILNSFIENYYGLDTVLPNVYSKYPSECQSFITPIDLSDEEYVKRWNAISYVPKELPKDKQSFNTLKGDTVRSKSELIIANTLYLNNIPYKYECPLTLKDNSIIYPDFTILNVSNRKVIYWEHRGMMDDRDYSKHTVYRLKNYAQNNLYLGDNLIITEETSGIPLNTTEIELMINHYLK